MTEHRSNGEAIEQQAAAIRTAGALGRSTAVQKLFDYLVAQSVAGEQPKEVEIALAVFGKRGDFDGGQDASVRVCMHRLRRKLDDYYAHAGAGAEVRLAIPRGQYRLALVQSRPRSDLPASRSAFPSARAVLILTGVIVLLNAIAWGAWVWTHRDAAAAARRFAPWSQVAQGRLRPLVIVVGDYYIFAEEDALTGTNRLIREYDVNSREDLDRYLMNHDAAMGRYEDVGLSYLPVAVAPALRHIMPILQPRAGDRSDLRVIPASEMTAEIIRRNDIIYIGYMSGLGLLRDPVFASSRYRIGDTWDQLIDRRTGQTYASQEGGPDSGKTQRDYGYLSAFPGPSGNRIVIVAGMRDVGLAQVSEASADPASLSAIRRGAGDTDSFEALYAVDGLRRSTMGGRLVRSSPLAADRIWEPRRTPMTFPEG